MSRANAIVLDDFRSSGTDHIEGQMYVGGDLNYSGYFKFNQREVPEMDIDGVQGGLIVGGNVNANLQKTGNAPGAAQIGGAYNGDPNTGGLTLNTGVTGIPVTEMTLLFEGLSQQLASLGATAGSAFSLVPNQYKIISGAGDANGLAVLNLSETDAKALLSPTFGQNVDLVRDPNVTGFFINVAGTDFTGADAINVQLFQNQQSDSQFVIFNFFEAQTIKFLSNANGTFLAPYADIGTAPGGMHGLLVAESMSLDGEVRPINNTTGYGGTLPPPTPVPLPAAGWVLVAGFGALGALRRARRAA